MNEIPLETTHFDVFCLAILCVRQSACPCGAYVSVYCGRQGLKTQKYQEFRMLKRIHDLINSVIGDSAAGVTKAIGVTVANEGREE